MTFLELTVVIVVLLSLLTIFFIGARAWKKGSDRSVNILNLYNVQHAVRGHANIHVLAIGAPLAPSAIIGPDKYLTSVTSPNLDITYLGKFDSVIPPVGTLYLNPGYSNATAISDFAPVLGSYAQW